MEPLIAIGKVQTFQGGVLHRRRQRMVHRIAEDCQPEVRFLRFPQALYGESIHRSSEQLKRAIHPSQNALLAHDFEHVIETWTNRPAADRYASRMDQFAYLASD